jgi:chromatin remodeling complex protein RSC6
MEATTANDVTTAAAADLATPAAPVDVSNELREAVKSFLSGADVATVTLRSIRDAMPERLKSTPEFATKLREIALAELAAITGAGDRNKDGGASDADDDDGQDSEADDDDPAAPAPAAAATAASDVSGSKKAPAKRTSVFSKPVQLSASLAAFLGSDGIMSRPEVTKALWAYIKGKLPKVKGGWACDEAMAAVFKRKIINFGSLNKELVRHLKDPALLVDAPNPAAAAGKKAKAVPPRRRSRGAEEEEEDEEEEEEAEPASTKKRSRATAAGAPASSAAAAKKSRQSRSERAEKRGVAAAAAAAPAPAAAPEGQGQAEATVAAPTAGDAADTAQAGEEAAAPVPVAAPTGGTGAAAEAAAEAASS